MAKDTSEPNFEGQGSETDGADNDNNYAEPKKPDIRHERDRGDWEPEKRDWKRDGQQGPLPEEDRSAFSFDTEASIEGVENPVGPDQFDIHRTSTTTAITPCGEAYSGMEVIGSDGNSIGIIKEFQENVILINRWIQKDLRVPFSACTSIEEQKLHLDVPSDVIDNRGWAR